MWAGSYFEWVNEENKDTATALVLAECKNNSQPFAFFVQRQQITELNDNRIHYGGFPSFSMDPKTKVPVPLHKLLKMKDWHHYCQVQEVATQFCTFERNDKKLKAGPNENYSKSFSRLAVITASDSTGRCGLHLNNIKCKCLTRSRFSQAQSIGLKSSARALTTMSRSSMRIKPISRRCTAS